MTANVITLAVAAALTLAAARHVRAARRYAHRADAAALDADAAAAHADTTAAALTNQLSAARFTAAYWHQAVLDQDNIPAAHALACVRAALAGETRPAALGIHPDHEPDFTAALTTQEPTR
ncbi:hypothetical protein [Streptomyces sp. WMMC897]|uniref:hypothetical protein n=1 Tax=Streptomyces sp. WMMC897 TaxID=3014782 RepID=UPI0022B6A791|nr:hypothetical protein [Streptomyces sp. WMMC897]MCZ7414293.1 hypothetical protein [Streptomyces sp. WMMC897]